MEDRGIKLCGIPVSMSELSKVILYGCIYMQYVCKGLERSQYFEGSKNDREKLLRYWLQVYYMMNGFAKGDAMERVNEDLKSEILLDD